MNRSRLFLATLGVTALLLLTPVGAKAHFIIEFTDGTNITVSNYREIGQTVKVYTQQGWFAFRKEDIARIIDTTPKKGTRNQDALAETKLTSPVEVKKKAERQQFTIEQQQTPTQEQDRQKQSQLEKLKTESTFALLKQAFSQFMDFPDLGEVYQRIKGGLFSLRYIFALLLGIKVLKLFLTASIR
jgi:hypothetical protein